MTLNIDASTMRQINKSSVINIIFRNNPISRIEIAHRSSLNKATVSYLVDELISEQMVFEIGYGVSSRAGRKPVLLEFNAKAGYCIGIQLDVSYMKTVVTDLKGEVVYASIEPLPVNDPPTKDGLTLLLVQAIQAAVNHAPASPRGIVGVGIALPGLIFLDSGMAILSNYQIRDWDIREKIGQYFDFPVFVENDGHCGALAEASRRQARDLVYVHVGFGIGGGIVLDGHLRKGVRGVAGSLGHTTISTIGLRCTCGNYGCWEQYAAEPALLRYLHDSGMATDFLTADSAFIEHAIDGAHQGIREYHDAFRNLGEYLGVGIANISASLNPEVVVIGGKITRAHQYFMDTVKSVMQMRAGWATDLGMVTHATEDAVVLGTISVVLGNTILNNPLHILA